MFRDASNEVTRDILAIGIHSERLKRMNLVASLLTQIAGGTAAIALDEAKPNWTYYIGAAPPSAAKPMGSPGIAITPGAMAAVATAVLLAVLPGKARGAAAPMWKSIAADVAGGALVAEGTKLGITEVVPRVKSLFAPKGVTVPPGAVPLMYGVSGHPGLGVPNYGGRSITDVELTHALNNYRRAA